MRVHVRVLARVRLRVCVAAPWHRVRGQAAQRVRKGTGRGPRTAEAGAAEDDKGQVGAGDGRDGRRGAAARGGEGAGDVGGVEGGPGQIRGIKQAQVAQWP